MKKLILCLIFAIPFFSAEANDLKCTIVKGSKNEVRIERCANTEVICYIGYNWNGKPLSMQCFTQRPFQKR